MLQEGSEEAVFTLKEGWDTEWLDTALEADPELEAGEAMASEQFLTEVCGTRGFSRILYSKEHLILCQQCDILDHAMTDIAPKYPQLGPSMSVCRARITRSCRS